jgi:hypothetical protein
MTTSNRRLGFIGLALAGFLVLGAACGSSSKSSSSTTTVASASSGSSGSSGTSLSGSCLDLEKMVEQMATEIGAAFTSSNAQGDFATLESAMQNATANVPSQVKSDWQTIVTAYTKFVNAIKGINLADLTNPATAAQVQAAASEMNSPAVQQASDNINAWAKQNCG